MKTSIVNVMGKKLFVVDTGIEKAIYKPGITSLKLKDDKKNDVFAMEIDMTADEGVIGSYGVSCNGLTDDGKLAITIKMSEKDTAEDMKVRYGSKLVSAERFLDALKNQMKEESEAIDAIFDIPEAGTQEDAE